MKKILIIDDEPKIGQSYVRLLAEEGYTVKYALSAQAATNLMIREPFDLVLLDINMPEVDGKVMYEVVREYDRDLKVIVSSVHSIEDQIVGIPGATAYHNKAQGVEQLLTKIKEVLGSA
ncbi:MAG: response regulator [Candidatus Omnitrophica bacterium]|nr:response regulator [Candidatus Omnitrophota bacterium]